MSRPPEDRTHVCLSSVGGARTQPGRMASAGSTEHRRLAEGTPGPLANCPSTSCAGGLWRGPTCHPYRTRGSTVSCRPSSPAAQFALTLSS